MLVKSQEDQQTLFFFFFKKKTSEFKMENKGKRMHTGGMSWGF